MCFRAVIRGTCNKVVQYLPAVHDNRTRAASVRFVHFSVKKVKHIVK